MLWNEKTARKLFKIAIRDSKNVIEKDIWKSSHRKQFKIEKQPEQQLKMGTFVPVTVIHDSMMKTPAQ